MQAADHRTTLALLRLGLPSRQLAKVPAYFRAEAHIYDVEANAFRAIVPPAEVAADHRELIREDVKFARNYRRLAAYIAGPRRGHRPSAHPVVGLIPRYYRVLSDYRSKGYNLGGITGG